MKQQHHHDEKVDHSAKSSGGTTMPPYDPPKREPVGDSHEKDPFVPGMMVGLVLGVIIAMLVSYIAYMVIEPRNNTHGLSRDEIQAFGVLSAQLSESKTVADHTFSELSEFEWSVYTNLNDLENEIIDVRRHQIPVTNRVVETNFSKSIPVYWIQEHTNTVYVHDRVTNNVFTVRYTNYPVLMRHK